MIDDEKIIDLFFERSEQGIRELDNKYGAVCHNLSYNIVNNRQDAEECVNDAYLGAWNAIPPVRPNPLLSYIVKIVRNISLKIYWRKEAAKRSGHYTIPAFSALPPGQNSTVRWFRHIPFCRHAHNHNSDYRGFRGRVHIGAPALHR